jgi:hypothetical protein
LSNHPISLHLKRQKSTACCPVATISRVHEHSEVSQDEIGVSLMDSSFPT